LRKQKLDKKKKKRQKKEEIGVTGSTCSQTPSSMDFDVECEQTTQSLIDKIKLHVLLLSFLFVRL
jgi:hypothetical protein